MTDAAMIAGAVLAEDLRELFILAFDTDQPTHLAVPDKPVAVTVDELELACDQLEVFRARMARKVTPEQVHAVREARSSRAPGRRADKRYSEAVDHFCTDPDGLPRTVTSAIEIKQRRRGMMHFAEFMGDMQLAEIDADTLRAFRDGPLRTLPAHSNRLASSIKKTTMPETVKALREAGVDWSTMSLQRQAEHLGWISAMLGWLVKRGWLEKNPALELKGETGLTKKEQKDLARLSADDEDGRPPFSAEELCLIVSRPWFVTGSGSSVKKPAVWYPFEYWLPLLGLYAGLRIAEASQLWLSDLRQDGDGVWYLDINENTPDKSIKNEPSKRQIPVHARLIELGLLAYRARLLQEGYTRLFPELTWALSDARYAKEPIRKMSQLLLNLGMPRDSTKVFHCLRHNINDALARVPMSALPYADEHLRKFIRYCVMGHKFGTDANVKHYSTVTLTERRALVDAVVYDLPHIAALDIDYAIGCIAAGLANKKGHRRGIEDLGPAIRPS